MAVIGCDIKVGYVVGAEKLAQAKGGIWTKTHFYQQGNFLHAKTFLVAAGEPCVLEFRIDLQPLEKVAARIHQRLHQQMLAKGGAPTVGFSFSKAWKSVKNTAKKIGKSKLIKAVGKGIKSVATSKLVGGVLSVAAVAVPGVGIAALAAYGAANTAIKAVDKGRKLVQTAEAARRTIASAATLKAKLGTAKAQAPARVASTAQAAQARAAAQAKLIAQRAAQTKAQAQAKVTAQARIAAQAKAKATAATTASARAAQAQVAARAKATAAATAKAAAAARAQAEVRAKAAIAAGKMQATAAARNLVTQVKAAEARVTPVVNAAASLQVKLANPTVRAQLTTIKKQADSAKGVLAGIQQTAKFGTGEAKLDAQKSAAIVNLVARNEARIQSMSQLNAGGLPAMLIDARGRIVRGKFRVLAQTGGKNPDVLYTGPKSTTQKGAFTKIAGVIGARTPAGGTAVQKPWTIELWHAGGWHPQARHGARFGTHAEAAQAIRWYHAKGYQAQVAPYPRVKSQPKTRVGASPFPPPSPRERAAKAAQYEAWLKKHAPKRRSTRVGWSSPPAYGELPLIGCPCSDQGTEF